MVSIKEIIVPNALLCKAIMTFSLRPNIIPLGKLPKVDNYAKGGS